MSLSSFRNLVVWQKAHQLVLNVYRHSNDFPSHERFGLTAQMRRSAVSVPANIAEGQKKTRKDFLRFLDISQGSLEETKYYIVLSFDLGYIGPETYGQLYEGAEEVGKMICGLTKSLS